jgi:hypothetical protein
LATRFYCRRRDDTFLRGKTSAELFLGHRVFLRIAVTASGKDVVDVVRASPSQRHTMIGLQ